MNKEEKQKVLDYVLKTFETQKYKDYFTDMYWLIPEYVFDIPASTSLKYHNAEQCGPHGLVVHILMFQSIMEYIINLEYVHEKLDPSSRDSLRTVPFLHDCQKTNGGKYTVSNHPVLAYDFVMNTEVAHDIPIDSKEMIARLCLTHSGEWNSDFKTKKEIMPKPNSIWEFLGHLCDYLSSRSDLSWKIPDEIADVISNGEVTSTPNRTPSLESFVMPFGKYKGMTIIQIKKENPNYIEWALNNLQDKDFYSLFKEV